MSIFRSGLVKPVFVECVKEIKDGDFSFKVGDKYELVLDMGSMFVVKGPGGREAIVGKDVFKIAQDEA